jgi:hypothetical protein
MGSRLMKDGMRQVGRVKKCGDHDVLLHFVCLRARDLLWLIDGDVADRKD